MLLEFRVKNYRSFRDEAVLSMVASSDNELAETNLIDTGIESLPKVVNTAAIYGANGSGKSNLVNALIYMATLISESPGMKPKETFFRLDSESTQSPSEFEVTFIIDEIRYQYGFKLTKERVLEEWLFAYQTVKPQRWFFRKFNEESNTYDYKYSSHLKGKKHQIEFFTGKKSLYLSVSNKFNNTQLEKIVNYFEFINRNASITSIDIFKYGTHEYFSNLIISNREKIIIDLNNLDICIDDIKIDKVPSNYDKEKEIQQAAFIRKTVKGPVEFLIDEESDGTRKFFSLYFPISICLQIGFPLIVDELDRSLHPLLCRKIIQMFQNKKINPKGAQLIFTSHDTTLLDPELLRRDQIWFTDKDKDHASSLFSLAEFSARKGEAFAKSYLSGRYGAIPNL